MSDDIFNVPTPYPDVASLAQGYMNRADGERLLLPLPSPCRAGSGVRFVVFLSDGTPAFAGAGLCSQVSDQGGTVPPEQRYETLLDTLQFDERSRPVYDYIVAVRNAAYAQAAQGEDVAVDEVQTVVADESYSAVLAQEEPTQLVHADELSAVQPDASWDEAPSADPAAEQGTAAELGQEQAVQFEGVDVPFVEQPDSVQPDPYPAAMLAAEPQSFVPPPLPTGLLGRPARTTHWQPSPPRRPTPRPATGLFRYGAGGLPRPGRPPYPDLDPSAFVQPAPRPVN